MPCPAYLRGLNDPIVYEFKNGEFMPTLSLHSYKVIDIKNCPHNGLIRSFLSMLSDFDWDILNY